MGVTKRVPSAAAAAGAGGDAAAAAAAAAAAMRPIDARRERLLVQPRKPTRAERLPSAVHLSVSATASMAVAAAIFMAATATLSPPMRNHVQNGSSLAAVTVPLIAMPELGTSVTKGIQRILGVMAGGWLFCGLYLAVSAWWFLALCLGAFTFGVVAASNLLPGFEAGGPPAVVAAFVVCVGFPSPQAAVVATTVKTVGIGGGILVYTLFSSLLFPRTATQFAADTLALALAEMRDLADVLLRGQRAQVAAAADAAAGRVSSAPPPAHIKDSAPTLAATVPHHLKRVRDLLPACAKEAYVGRLPGGYTCYRPTPLAQEAPFTADALAAVHVANTVNRALWLLITTEPGEEPRETGCLTDAQVPKSLGADARGVIDGMADAVVGALGAFARAVHAASSGARRGSAGSARAAMAAAHEHARACAALCDDLYQRSLSLHSGGGGNGGGGGDNAAAAVRTPRSGGSGSAGNGALRPSGDGRSSARASSASGPGAARARWQNAAAAVLAAKRGAAAGPAVVAATGAAAKRGALGGVVDALVARGDADSVRWCATLLLLQQLSSGLGRLHDCLDALLPKLPGSGDELTAATPRPSGADNA